MPANLENSAVATGLEKVSFHSNPQKRQCQKCSNYRTIILNSHHSSKWVGESHSVTSDSLQPHALCSPWNSPGQNTKVGSLSLLQGIFPTQGSNPGLLPHCRQILYQLSDKGSPRILEWVAHPFSSRSSQPRVSCIAGRFSTDWAMREALITI